MLKHEYGEKSLFGWIDSTALKSLKLELKEIVKARIRSTARYANTRIFKIGG
ncbi:hypothetical protein AZE42_06932 [Rhizopogon vesiculosus]|uniref:Uncharacterized protein n=1 Tax=Rhizopogon vesiculosus TaxID=180088 RepID=A0A1J8QNT6_9AGAM|nr:hypothetical protein AZE42_06932 [Rhizopogon vesiculosus]